MFKPISPACISLAALYTAQAATARYPTDMINPPFYHPGAEPQIGGKPYQGPGFTIYPPGSPAAEQPAAGSRAMTPATSLN